ncbi:hypothetical protein [Spirosoma montaniterrae]|uniref:CBM20 domain-containing protein n=1 Tax=Spirosoma montaniterrae TaxID=1178516 RepID=A0A1P9WWZ8_9BACT|nr:hypothetical protein [Spirosoma montaniterrae]AQG79870.1 hypothetical protein AWR27_11355 [Spirosoma montaniterrae]
MKQVFSMIALTAVVLVGCTKSSSDPTPATDPNAIATTNVRITATVPSSVKADDKLSLAGNFSTASWDPKKSSSFELKKNSSGAYVADVPVSALPTTGNLEYKVVRNASASDNADGWKYVEKNDKCEELPTNRTITVSEAAGKEFKITIQNFRNTGTCGD